MRYLILIFIFSLSAAAMTCEPMCTLEAREKAVELENKADEEFKKSISQTLNKVEAKECDKSWPQNGVNTIITSVYELNTDGTVKTTWTAIGYVKNDSGEALAGKEYEMVKDILHCIAEETRKLTFKRPPFTPYYIFRDQELVSYNEAVKRGWTK